MAAQPQQCAEQEQNTGWGQVPGGCQVCVLVESRLSWYCEVAGSNLGLHHTIQQECAVLLVAPVALL